MAVADDRRQEPGDAPVSVRVLSVVLVGAVVVMVMVMVVIAMVVVVVRIGHGRSVGHRRFAPQGPSAPAP